MDTRLLNHVFIGTIGDCSWGSVGATTVPDTPDFSSGEDLGQTAGIDVSNLDEARVKEEDVWRMQGHALRITFPFYSASVATGDAVLVNVDTKLWNMFVNYDNPRTGRAVTRHYNTARTRLRSSGTCPKADRSRTASQCCQDLGYLSEG